MCFDECNRLGPYARGCISHLNDFGLALDTRGSKADLSTSVVVDSRTSNDASDRVRVLERIHQALQNDSTQPVSRHGPLRAGIKWTAMAVWRQNPPLLRQISLSLRHVNGH